MNVDEFERRFNALGKEMAELIMEFSGEANENLQQNELAHLLAHMFHMSTKCTSVCRTFRMSAGVDQLGKQPAPGRARATR